MREVKRKNRKTGKKERCLLPPLWTGHADFNHPFEFISFLRLMSDQEFDVMIEAKAKDLALLRLRQDLVRFAPDIATRFGIGRSTAEVADEELELDPEELEA
jgi:UV DNA damage endonuclease